MSGSLLSGQTSEEDVISLFSSKGNVEWVRTLKGSVNSMHPVQMKLGFDGTACRGFAQYEGIDKRFELQGTLKNGLLKMQELDSQGDVTGIIKGELRRDRFNGTWWSADMTRSADIALMDEGLILIERFEPKFCQIEGTAGGEQIDFMLSVESPSVISGTWLRQIECVRILGECEDFLCDNMRLIVLEGEMAGAVINMLESDGGYKIKVNGAEQPVNGKARVTSSTPLKIHAQAGYNYLADLAYPIIEDGGFDKWIGTRLDRWYEETIDHVASVEAENPSLRWIKSVSAWIDIFLMEDGLLSGMLTYFNTENDSYTREAFIYDMRAGSIMPLSELDKRDGGLLSKLHAYVADESRSAKDFKHVMLCEAGFILATDFDGVHGDELIRVPFDYVADALKKRSLLAKLED